MSGERYRFREFRMVWDEEPDAEPVTYAMGCAVCEACSPASGSPEDAREWATRHLGSHDGHFTYRLHLVRPVRAEPGRWL